MPLLVPVLSLGWSGPASPGWGQTDSPSPAPSASDPTRPVSVLERAWSLDFYRQDQELKSGKARVCFLGDSLTAFWTSIGIGSWALDFEEFAPVNAGYPGDRVENIHFRARELNFGETAPDVFVVLAGTNNLGQSPPDAPKAVADGVFALVATLRRRAPHSRILLLSILPSGVEPGSPLRQAIRETNDILKTGAADAGCTWLDIHDAFLDVEGRWLPGLTLDGTHLTAKGYDRLAIPVRKQLLEWFSKP